jgi:putative ABC transport system permease protein
MQQTNFPRPPKWPNKLLEWFCPDELLEEVQGDLHERYGLRMQKMGKKKARNLYFREVLTYMRPSVIRKKNKSSQVNYYDMFNNSLKTGWRNMTRNKAHAALMSQVWLWELPVAS